MFKNHAEIKSTQSLKIENNFRMIGITDCRSSSRGSHNNKPQKSFQLEADS